MRLLPRNAAMALAIVACLSTPQPVRAAGEQGEAFKPALGAAARLGKDWNQSAFARIAVAQARADRLAEARRTLETALANPPKRYADGSMSDYPELQLAVAFALTGRPHEALHSARAVKGASSRAVAIAEMAASLPTGAFRADAFREAVSLAANSKSPENYDRLNTLILIAKHQHAAGYTSEAVATLQIAASVAEARIEPNARVSDFSQVVQAMAEIGAMDAAREVYARALESSPNLAPETARPELVRAAIAVGRLDTALVEAKAVRHSDYRLDALCETGIAYAARADTAKAAAIFDLAVEDMKSTPYQWVRRFLHMPLLARLAGKARCPEKAIALINEQIPAAREMSDVLTRSSMLVYEGQALSELGQDAKAVTVLKEAAAAEREIDWEKVQGAGPMPDATIYLVKSLLNLGDVKSAEQVIAQFKDLGSRAYALEQMSRIAAESGNLRLAFTCAAKVKYTSAQLRAYLLIATSPTKRAASPR